MVRIQQILLVDVEFEELVMGRTFEILEPLPLSVTVPSQIILPLEILTCSASQSSHQEAIAQSPQRKYHQGL